jgi:hypothetical protein
MVYIKKGGGTGVSRMIVPNVKELKNASKITRRVAKNRNMERIGLARETALSARKRHTLLANESKRLEDLAQSTLKKALKALSKAKTAKNRDKALQTAMIAKTAKNDSNWLAEQTKKANSLAKQRYNDAVRIVIPYLPKHIPNVRSVPKNVVNSRKHSSTANHRAKTLKNIMTSSLGARS